VSAASGDRVDTPPLDALPRLLLLRHAWAGDRADYDGDDRERPLDARGRRQADLLPAHLASVGITAPILVSSPFERCRATLEPIARATDAVIRLDDDLAEIDPPLPSDDGWPAAAWLGARALRAIDTAGTDLSARTRYRWIVVCSHGELLPAALAALAGRHHLDVPSDLDLTRKALPKGAGWLLDTSAERWVTVVPAPDEGGGHGAC
jgi:hypothetical protein